MKKIFYLIFILIVSNISINAQSFCDTKCKASLAAYAIGSGLDIHSTLGKNELNPFSRNTDGTFNPTKNILLKSGLVGITLIGQKQYPKAMTISRFVLAGLFAGIAIRNYKVK